MFLLIALMWLVPAPAAEATPLIAFAEDSSCQPRELPWVIFSPSGIGIVDLRVYLPSIGQCKSLVPFSDGWFAGGGPLGGGSGGFPGGLSPGSIASWPGALQGEGEFELGMSLDPFDPSPFSGDFPGGSPTGNGTGIGFTGSNLVPLIDSPFSDDFGSPRFEDGPGLSDLNGQNLTAVPEPGSLLLLGTGLAFAVRRFRRR